MCSLLLLLLMLYTKKVLLSSSEKTTPLWVVDDCVSSVARRPPLDFGGWSQSVFFQNVLLPFATARRAPMRREEAEREVASREEKRREDGFPVNRPRRLARAQTRPTAFRVRRRHYHPRYGGGLFFFMRRRKRRFCVRACKARSKIVRETSVCLSSHRIGNFFAKVFKKTRVLDAT